MHLHIEGDYMVRRAFSWKLKAKIAFITSSSNAERYNANNAWNMSRTLE